MKLSLHLGAHKTASTYIQKRLGRNRAVLDKRGVLYIPLDELRANFSVPILDIVPRKKGLGRFLVNRRARTYLRDRIAERAARADPPLQRVVLSDENFIGSPRRIVTSGRLYPDIGAKLTLLRDYLDGFEIEIFFGIRHQGAFASSVFAEALRHSDRAVYSETAFRNAWLAGDPNWAQVIDEIVQVFPNSPAIVWNYDDFGALERRLMNRICGETRRKRFPKRLDPIRESFSQAAMEELLRIQDVEGPAMRKAKLRETRLKYPRGETYPPYSLWSEEQLAELGALFEADLAAIDAIGGQVTLLRPKPRKARRKVRTPRTS